MHGVIGPIFCCQKSLRWKHIKDSLLHNIPCSYHALLETNVYVKASSAANIAITSQTQDLRFTCKDMIVVRYDSFKTCENSHRDFVITFSGPCLKRFCTSCLTRHVQKSCCCQETAEIKPCKFRYVKPVGNFKVICFDVDEKPLEDSKTDTRVIILVSYMKFRKI